MSNTIEQISDILFNNKENFNTEEYIEMYNLVMKLYLEKQSDKKVNNKLKKYIRKCQIKIIELNRKIESLIIKDSIKKIKCNICGREVNEKYLKRHQRNKICVKKSM